MNISDKPQPIFEAYYIGETEEDNDREEDLVGLLPFHPDGWYKSARRLDYVIGFVNDELVDLNLRLYD